MAIPDPLSAALSPVARTLADGFEITDVLHDLTERVAEVLALPAAGISLRQDGKLQHAASLNEIAVTAADVNAAPDRSPGSMIGSTRRSPSWTPPSRRSEHSCSTPIGWHLERTRPPSTRARVDDPSRPHVLSRGQLTGASQRRAHLYRPQPPDAE